MSLEKYLQDIEQCQTLEDLKKIYQTIIENFGFSGYNFMDTGKTYNSMPYTDGTSGKRWEEEYQTENFVDVDPCISHARRTHRAFTWDQAPMPIRAGKHKPRGLQLMDAAQDHGFKQGFVVPYHFVDSVGRTYSSLVVLFWKEGASDFQKQISEVEAQVQVLTIYWIQKVVDVVYDQFKPKAIENIVSNSSIATLSDREREVLRWTALGKTSPEVAEILDLSDYTVRDHWKTILKKTGASTRTAAAMQALQAGIIDI
ncbi:MAG: autoinducer binding domain-containing protein [Pseudomonadota bacterium]